MNRMGRHLPGVIAATALALAGLAFASSIPATGQQPTPQPAQPSTQQSVKSSPPDRNVYIRPAIPEDRINTPVPPPHLPNPPQPSRER